VNRKFIYEGDKGLGSPHPHPNPVKGAFFSLTLFYVEIARFGTAEAAGTLVE
jgi:hypothetical protein